MFIHGDRHAVHYSSPLLRHTIGRDLIQRGSLFRSNRCLQTIQLIRQLDLTRQARRVSAVLQRTDQFTLVALLRFQAPHPLGCDAMTWRVIKRISFTGMTIRPIRCDRVHTLQATGSRE